MMKSDQKKPVTLEDLLRLKRAERPSAEFWPRFERELRAKQLAAIVARRPWWSELPHRIFSNLSRYHLPLGATAVLAVTFISLRHYQPAESSPVLASSLKAISASTESVSPALEREVARAAVPPAPSAEDDDALGRNETVAANAPASLEAVPSVTNSRMLRGDVSAMNALLGVSGSEGSENGKNSIASTSVSLPGANFASLSSSIKTPFNPAILAEKRGFENRVLPARSVDPLANVTPPDRVRIKKYQPDTVFPSSEPVKVVSARSSDRIVRGMSDERLYETSSRIGFGGNHLALKF